ncbi:MAG: DUF1700 domain-containing protein [Candidatus Izemoplasmatales bacterium]
MTKKTFIETLKNGLAKMNISDSAEIIRDYETHFTNELAKGKSEEEIASEIGDIEQILADFSPQPTIKTHVNGRGALLIGLTISDFFVFLFFIIASIMIFIPIALFASGSAIGVYYVCGLKMVSIFPNMPYGIGLLFGITFLFLGLIGLAATYFYARFLTKMIRQYSLWHHMVVSKTEKPVLIFSRPSKIMSKMLLISSFGFIIFGVFAYIVAAVVAGNLGFWHVWHWFV